MLLVVVMFLTVVTDATNISVSTYQLHDPVTGVTLTCNRCPPGHHMQAHCTTTYDTQCVPCKPRHFTQYWNYLSKCLYCNNFCGENEFVKKECSPENNRLCECREGYYHNHGFCVRHRKCPSGQGVEREGNAHRDTMCAKCSTGTYSATSSAHEPCISHNNCKALGLQTVVKGTVWHDNICASCEDLNARGAFDYFRKILPNFFAHQRIKPKKAHRFMRRLLIQSRGVRLREHTGDFDNSNILENHFRKWLKEASKNRLKELPEFLRRFKLFNVADKLERKMKQVVDGAKLCKITT
ncbi:tumor necrosis factor receptor superfamily member 6B-like [Conger conger]|uniref:tumor necrosis factor receptor superfamily member 6B-like n=1 Tax=Conger conger TaxID=82655 RepID=UPI002A59EFE0|nr:tumor necrosis factor receptor superfamily member 6B-like [Conger conger]